MANPNPTNQPWKHKQPGFMSGGSQWTRPREQFCALYEKLGVFTVAAREAGYRGEKNGQPVWDLDEAIILWKNDNRPTLDILRNWAQKLDDGGYTVTDQQRTRMAQRLANRFDATIRESTLDLIRSNTATARYINDRIAAGEINAELSPFLQHANNGVQNTVRALKEAFMKGDNQPSRKAGKLKIRAAKPRPQIAAPQGDVVNGEFREVASASTA